MIVCVCNNISNKDILKYMSQNKNTSLENLTQNLPCCNQCEVCKFDILDLIKENTPKH